MVHRQSVVHSMVEWDSGGVMAQLARPDMKLPIQIALLGEGKNIVPPLDFPALRSPSNSAISKISLRKAGTRDTFAALAVRNGDERGKRHVCGKVLRGRLRFTQFYPVITQTVQRLQKRCSELPLTVDNIKK